MLPDRVSNPGPLTYESGALPIALRGPARRSRTSNSRPFCTFIKPLYPIDYGTSFTPPLASIIGSRLVGRPGTESYPPHPYILVVSSRIKNLLPNVHMSSLLIYLTT